MVLETVGSSKSNDIRSLLIQAWRERWTDMQWGIHIKTVLPRYISGDIYHLSDCILQQALMGPLPNQLILSYLRHSLAAHVVSYGGVIESISKYESLQKSHCVRALLQIMADVTNKVTCRGKPEDCLALATALVAGVRWLLRVALFAAGRAQSPDQTTNLKKSLSLLEVYLHSPFLVGLLHIARLEDATMWSTVLVLVSELESKVPAVTVLADLKDVLPKVLSDLRNTNQSLVVESSVKYDPRQTPICYGLHARVMVEAVMNSTQNSQALASQLILYQQLKGLSEKDLYLELLVSCYLGLGSDEKFPHQNLHWVGFTFVKLPALIQHLHSSFHGSTSSPSPSAPLLAAVQQLARRTSLLDVADHHMKANCLDYLLHELILRSSLLLELDAKAVITSRQQDPMAVCIGAPASKENSATPMGFPSLILRALPTVSSILKTLSNKNHESVLPVMNLLISGKSRDLLLSAAAASGKLFIYAQKFVKFNQQSLEPQPGETEAMAKNRAMMFDTTFLLLCHIAQVYGIDVVVGEESETFVESWMRCHMPERGRVKMVTPQWRAEHSGLAEVMQQVNAQDMCLKYVQAHWSKVCCAAPQIMQKLTLEVILGSISLQAATEILDHVCGLLCSLPICFTAWTCSYLHEVSGAQEIKVNALLNHLQLKLANQEPPLTLGSFKDRSLLMSEIIDNMVKVTRETNLLKSKKDNEAEPQGYSYFSAFFPTDGPNSLPMDVESTEHSNENELDEELKETWNQVFCKSGVLTHAGLWAFERLLRLGGHQWFVSNLVQCAMESVFEADLNRATDLVYGIFQLNVQQCCITLLLHTLPQYLDEPGNLVLHSHRRIGSLARLFVQVLVAAWAGALPSTLPQGAATPPQGSSSSPHHHSSSSTSSNHQNLSRKRSFSIMSGEEVEDSLVQQAYSVLTIEPSCVQGVGDSGVAIMVAMQMLLTKLCRSVPRGVVSPVSELVVSVLQELVAAPGVVSPLMTLMPPNLLSVVLALHPPTTFSPAQLLALALPPPYPSLPSPLTPYQEASSRRAAAKILCTHRNFLLAAESPDSHPT